jgi:hypothetical protein
MRRALKSAEEHSKENKYNFNINKCKLICGYKSDLCINRQRLEVVKEFKYLGIVFNKKGPDLKKQLENNFTRARKTLFGILNFINSPHVKTSSSISLYKTFVKAKLEYGMFLTAHKVSTLKKLQVKKYIIKSNNESWKTDFSEKARIFGWK